MKLSILVGLLLTSFICQATESTERHLVSIQEVKSGVYHTEEPLGENCYVNYAIDKERWTVTRKITHDPISKKYCELYNDSRFIDTFYKCTFDECVSVSNAENKLIFLNEKAILVATARRSPRVTQFKVASEVVPEIFDLSVTSSRRFDVPDERSHDRGFISEQVQATTAEMKNPLKHLTERRVLEACFKYYPEHKCVLSLSELKSSHSREVRNVAWGVAYVDVYVWWRAIIKL